MNKFNLESAKFISIIIGICFIFILVIWHAFDYLPQAENTTGIVVEENIKQEELSENEINDDFLNQEETEELEETERNEITEENKSSKFEIQEITPLESIEQNESSSIEDSSATNSLEKARKYSKNGQPVQALSEYKKIISATDDKEIKAQCYEEIAVIYAKDKRYGSALSAAQLAFNTSPNSAREVLLARLYYKTGDTEKASVRIDNVLKRDF